MIENGKKPKVDDLKQLNKFWYKTSFENKQRKLVVHQKPFILWLTGLSGAGKSTIADLLEQKLFEMNKHTYILDGDNLRHGLNKDLDFSKTSREENIRRIAEVAKLMIDAGLIVIVSIISPFNSDRKNARSLVMKNEFFEIFVNAPLSVCEKRDPKGLYKKARLGEIKNFTGIDSVYETPTNPEIILNSDLKDPNTLTDEVIEFLKTGELI